MTRGRRLPGDDRGWVPFAVVGVLLLVASAALLAGIQPDPPPAEPATEVATERAVAETGTALRGAVAEAGEAAARDPVLEPADTSAGRVLDEGEPFRDAFRIRIYLQAKDRLEKLTVERQGVTATASLPPAENATALREAKERVSVTPADENATAVRVRVENVTVTVRRHNRTVVRRTVSPTVVVRTPVLAVHDRVSTFEDRLNNGLADPGLTRRLTGRLYAVTWARGYAQYGSAGAVIENVVANRHIELLTNGAVLREQRHAFGQSDADGRAAMQHATAGVGLADLVGNTDLSVPVLGSPTGGRPGPHTPAEIPTLEGDFDGPAPDDEMTVGVNDTGDAAFANAAEPSNLTSALQSAYTVDARVVANIDRRSGWLPPCSTNEPDGYWRLVNDPVRQTDIGVESDINASIRPDDGWHLVAGFGRRVTRTQERVCHWRRGNETEITTIPNRFTYDVEVAVVSRHVPTKYAPSRDIATAHRAGHGPFDGPNLAGVSDRVRERLIDQHGGRDGLAEWVVSNDIEEGDTVQVRGELPDGIRRWALDDLVAFRDRVKNVSTTVTRGEAGTLRASPAATLQRELDGVLDPPDEYNSTAQAAKYAARGAYVEKTTELLDERRADADRRADDLDGAFDRVGVGSIDLLEAAFGNRSGVRTEAGEADAGGVNFTSVKGSPPYLTGAAVGPDYVDSLPAGGEIYPLAARNVNLFAVPHGDAASALFDDGSTTSLRSAARTLHASEHAMDIETENETLDAEFRQRAAELDPAVGAKVQLVREWYLRPALERADVEDRAGVIDEGLASWETNASRALALTNGSAAERIADVAIEGNDTRQALLAAELRNRLRTAARSDLTRIERANVSRTERFLRAAVGKKVDAALERAAGAGGKRAVDALERRVGRSVNRVPAGLPIVPFGPAWWVTANVWIVEVRGGYDRFAVTARTGPAGGPADSLTYVRDGSAVTIDYDGDGQRERFGTAGRISFQSRTAVAIAVPPGPQGVGDTDGIADERSDGWSVWRPVDSGGGGRGTVPPTWPGRD